MEYTGYPGLLFRFLRAHNAKTSQTNCWILNSNAFWLCQLMVKDAYFSIYNTEKWNPVNPMKCELIQALEESLCRWKSSSTNAKFCSSKCIVTNLEQVVQSTLALSKGQLGFQFPRSFCGSCCPPLATAVGSKFWPPASDDFLHLGTTI